MSDVLSVERLYELRGWTAEAIERLGVTIEGSDVVFPVRDATGDVLSVERYLPDPATRNGRRKMRAESGATRELFPPPEIIADDEPSDGLLWLVEGHADTVRMWSIGLPAVGVPGAQCWKDRWAARFARPGWRVIVCCDCDDEGRDLASRVASALDANGVDVRMLDLDATREDGYDLSDFLAGATTPELRARDLTRLQAMVAALPPFGELIALPLGPISIPVASNDVTPTGERVTVHTWHPLDLITLGATPPEPPAISGLFYPGRRHVVSGEAEAGKSWLVQTASADEIKTEHGALWIDDDDMGPSAVLERLRALALVDDEIRSLFVYMRPAEALSPAALADVLALIRERDVRLVVFDAFNASLALHGLDPSKTPDVEAFFQHVVNPFCEAGAAVVLPDHVAKHQETRGKYAYGSERKHTGVDVHLGLQPIAPFGRGRTGKAKLTVHKDRPGFLRRPTVGLFVLESDPETGYCTWRIEADDVGDDGVFRPTVLMARVSEYLCRLGTACSRNQIEKDVPGKGSGVRQAIDVLVAEGYASEVDGPRGARLVQHERNFHEDDE